MFYQRSESCLLLLVVEGQKVKLDWRAMSLSAKGGFIEIDEVIGGVCRCLAISLW